MSTYPGQGPNAPRNRLPPQPQFENPWLPWRPYFAGGDRQIQIVSTKRRHWFACFFAFSLSVSAVALAVIYRMELIMCLEMMADSVSTDREAQLKGFLVLGYLGVVLVV